MPCEWIKLPDGSVAHVRYAKRRAPKCQFCGAPSTKQCDYPLSKTKTCDAYMCDRCSKPFGPNVDTCPEHPVMRFF